MKRASISVGLRLRLGNTQHASHEKWPAVEELNHLEALVALANEMVSAVRRGDVAHDVGDRAHAVHIDRGGIGNIGGTLHQDADLALLADCLLGGGDGARTTDGDRQHQAREQDHIADRNDDERIRRQRRRGRRSAICALVRCAEKAHVSHATLPAFSNAKTRHPSDTEWRTAL